MNQPARVGLLLPASNTVMEPDLAAALAPAATVHTARMRLGDPVTPQGELEMLDRHAEPAAGDLGTLGPDLVVLGCTSAASLRGFAADLALRERLAAIAGAPVVGILDSLARSLRLRGLRRITLLTPYVEQLTAKVAEHLSGEGFELAATSGLGIADNVAVGRVTPEAVVGAAAEALAPGSEAVAIACTNLRALEAAPLIEAELGVAVVTANSAVIELVRAELGAG